MSRAASLLRLIVASAAAFAVSIVPVARAFAANAPIAAADAFVSGRDGGSSTHIAHRMPRLRRPKQSFFAVLPESGPFLPAVSSARRSVPARRRSVRAASFAALLDHPPA